MHSDKYIIRCHMNVINDGCCDNVPFLMESIIVCLSLLKNVVKAVIIILRILKNILLSLSLSLIASRVKIQIILKIQRVNNKKFIRKFSFFREYNIYANSLLFVGKYLLCSGKIQIWNIHICILPEFFYINILNANNDGK